MNRLLEMSKQLLSEGDIEQVLMRAIDSAIELCHAERGLILFFDAHEQIIFQTYRDLEHRNLAAPEFEISRTIIEQAKKCARPVFMKNACADPAFSKQKSVARLKLLSVICIPLIQQDEIFGLIYLDNRSVRGIFSQEQCNLMQEFAEFICLAASRAFALKKLQNSNTEQERQLRQRYRFDAIIGHHPQLLEILQMVGQIAGSDVNVLIQGESGTGKELFARTLHYNSRRSGKPFSPINCAAIPETLIESELFGHTRGAYTGAIHDTEGLFHKADGGTLFLDEISELPLSLQPKLLRILQTGEYMRLGSEDLRFADVRIIAATSKILPDLISAGHFRDDLYYRLNVIEFTLPPLRQRREDIPLLIAHFLETYKNKQGKPLLRISAESVTCMMRYTFPGNIRELENIIQRAVVLAEGDLIEPRHLPARLHEQIDQPEKFSAITPFQQKKKWMIESFEKDYLIHALTQANGNITLAAKSAGMNVKNLHCKMKKYHLRYETFRNKPPLK